MWDGIYVTTDSGTHWTQTSAPQKPFWRSITSSTDGIRIFAVTNNGGGVGGQIYISTNSGSTWATVSSPSLNWVTIACSSDGTTIAAANDWCQGSIYVSTNSGSSWALSLSPSPCVKWRGIAISSDGSRIAANSLAGGVYLSKNSGASWLLMPAIQSTPWQSIASSSDGSQVVAVVAGTGKNYVNVNSTLVSTGASGNLGQFDPDWVLVSTPSAANCSQQVFITQYPYPRWVVPNGGGHWISPSNDETEYIDTPGYYTYQTSFTLNTTLSRRANLVTNIQFDCALDDHLVSVVLNGNTVLNGDDAFLLDSLSSFTILGAYQSNNVLQFKVLNGYPGLNPTGLLVQFTSVSVYEASTGIYVIKACAAGWLSYLIIF